MLELLGIACFRGPATPPNALRTARRPCARDRPRHRTRSDRCPNQRDRDQWASPGNGEHPRRWVCVSPLPRNNDRWRRAKGSTDSDVVRLVWALIPGFGTSGQVQSPYWVRSPFQLAMCRMCEDQTGKWTYEPYTNLGTDFGSRCGDEPERQCQLFMRRRQRVGLTAQ